MTPRSKIAAAQCEEFSRCLGEKIGDTLYSFPSIARARTSSLHSPAAGRRAPPLSGTGGSPGMPSDSNLVQVSPFHHLCRRSPAGPRANTSSRDVPPPPATGALESGTSPCSVGYIGSSSSGARTGAKGDQPLPFHFLISSSPEVLRAKIDIQRLPQAAAEMAPAMGKSPPRASRPPRDSRLENSDPFQVVCTSAPVPPPANRSVCPASRAHAVGAPERPRGIAPPAPALS